MQEQKNLGKPRLWTKPFVLVCIVNLFMFAGFQMLLPTIPLYVEELGGGRVAVGLVGGVFSVSAIFIRLFAGRMLDQGSRKNVFVLGLAIGFLALLFYQWASTLVLLIILRLLHGLGFGMSTTASGTIAADLIPRERFGEGIGYFGLTNTFTMAVAPAIGLFVLASTGSFKVLFIGVAASGLIALLTSLLIATPDVPQVRGMEKAYRYIEPAAVIPSVVMLFLTMPLGAVLSFIALYAKETGIENIGMFFTVYAVALALTRPTSGVLSDRYGIEKIVLPGIVFMVVAMFLIGSASSNTYFMVAAIFFGFSLGMVTPSMQALTLKNVRPSRMGAANGTFFSAFDIGIGLGSLLWGVIAQQYGYNVMYYLTIVPIIIGLVVFIRGARQPKEEDTFI